MSDENERLRDLIACPAIVFAYDAIQSMKDYLKVVASDGIEPELLDPNQLPLGREYRSHIQCSTFAKYAIKALGEALMQHRAEMYKPQLNTALQYAKLQEQEQDQHDAVSHLFSRHLSTDLLEGVLNSPRGSGRFNPEDYVHGFRQSR